MAFPTLTRRYKDIKYQYFDNLIQTAFEGNYEHRRQRAPRERLSITLIYDLLSDADKVTLLNHYATVGLHTSFVYTDNDSNSYTVYYNKPLSWDRKYLVLNKFDTIELVEL